MKALAMLICALPAFGQGIPMGALPRAGGGGGATPVVVSFNAVALDSSSAADTVPLAMTAGNTAIVGVGYFPPGPSHPPVTLSDGSTCTYDGGGTDPNTNYTLYLYHCAVGTGITGATVSEAGTSYPCISILQVSKITGTLDTALALPYIGVGALWGTSVLNHTAGISALDVALIYGSGGGGNTLLSSPTYTVAGQATTGAQPYCGLAYKIDTVTSSTYQPNGTESPDSANSTLGATYK